MTITASAGTAAGRPAISAVTPPSVTTRSRSSSRPAGMPGFSRPVRLTAVSRAVRAPVESSVSTHRVSWPVTDEGVTDPQDTRSASDTYGS